MVVFDSTFLTFVFVPNARCAVDRAKERIDHLIADLHGKGERIRVPAPALSEVLVRTGHSTNEIIKELTRSPRFQVEPFDTKAAVEAAQIAISERKKGSKRGDSAESWAKVKYDRQIVAVAKSLGARTIYSEDKSLRRLAEACGIEAKGIADCPTPPSPDSTSTTGKLF
jgi:predicted nucleic acid-binding protein